VPSVERLKAHVTFLASDALAGRAAPEDRLRAATWVAERLAEAGAKPVPGLEGMLAPFQGDGFAGQNVLAWVAGTGEEWVLAGAHYDGPGTKGGVVLPGADDDASGVAALLEAARALAAGPRPRRSVLFAGFDLQRERARGSTAFAEKPPVPLARCAAATAAELLGRSLGDVVPGLLLAMGEERSEGLALALDALGEPPGLLVRRLGLDFHPLGASDAHAFAIRKVPVLLLSSGASPDHGRAGDTAERIAWDDLARRTGAWTALLRALADAPERPAWKDVLVPTKREMEHLLDLVRRGEEKPDALRIPKGARPLATQFRAMLEGQVSRGAPKPRDRDSYRFMALTMFGYLAAPER
jgi:hypothetical protein